MKFFAALVLPLLLWANLSLQQLESMPGSLAKDFYIWLYLQQDISQEEAKKAYAQAQNKQRAKLKKAYLQKVATPNSKSGPAAKRWRSRN